MKQKWLEFSLGQKIIFCTQIFLIVLFIILYSTVGKQQVISFRDTPLRCRTDGTTITYRGKQDGSNAIFAVSENTVTYQIEDTVYGPYTVVFDPTAVISTENTPFNLTSTKNLVGVEVWADELRLFRGAYHSSSSMFYLVDSNGELIFHDQGLIEVLSSTGNSMVTTYTDAEAPGPYTILKILVAPNVTQRADPLGLLCGIFFCALCMISLLYADALFRWNLRFSIRNVEAAEPSDWELFSRWIGWLLFTVLAIAIFILGLTGM